MNVITEKQQHIWTVYDSSEEKFLRTPVQDFDMSRMSKKDAEELVTHMRRMMTQERGVGLSANQIGLPIRMFVCQLPTSDGKGYQGKFYAVFNPQIIASSTKKESDQEGCLSIPGIFGDVQRFYSITVKGLTKQGRQTTINAKGFLARIMQHEIDHLNGVLFTDTAHNVQKISGY